MENLIKKDKDELKNVLQDVINLKNILVIENFYC